MKIGCPECGEMRRLRGERADDIITVACEACGHTFERDVSLRCGLCGSPHLIYSPRALWEKGRGDQRTPAGRIDSYACADCGGLDVTSSSPRPAPTTPPGGGGPL